MPEFQNVCKVGELAAGAGKCFTVGGKKFAVFKQTDGSFRAIGDACTHMGASLAEGDLSGEMVVCPWHGAMFSLMNGAAAGPPARGGVGAFAVKVVGDQVQVQA